MLRQVSPVPEGPWLAERAPSDGGYTSAATDLDSEDEQPLWHGTPCS